jgi:hypothetical protein
VKTGFCRVFAAKTRGLSAVFKQEISMSGRSPQSAPPLSARAPAHGTNIATPRKEAAPGSLAASARAAVKASTAKKYASRCVASCIATVSLPVAPAPRRLFIIERDVCVVAGAREGSRKATGDEHGTRAHSRCHGVCVRHRPLQACKQPRCEHCSACSWRKRVAPEARAPECCCSRWVVRGQPHAQPVTSTAMTYSSDVAPRAPSTCVSRAPQRSTSNEKWTWTGARCDPPRRSPTCMAQRRFGP